MQGLMYLRLNFLKKSSTSNMKGQKEKHVRFTLPQKPVTRLQSGVWRRVGGPVGGPAGGPVGTPDGSCALQSGREATRRAGRGGGPRTFARCGYASAREAAGCAGAIAGTPPRCPDRRGVHVSVGVGVGKEWDRTRENDGGRGREAAHIVGLSGALDVDDVVGGLVALVRVLRVDGVAQIILLRHLALRPQVGLVAADDNRDGADDGVAHVKLKESSSRAGAGR